MSRRTTEDRERDRYARYSLAFQQACMSNAKWRKALTAIAESEIKLVRCEFKCIDSDHISHVDHGVHLHHIRYNRFSDGGFEPFEYKWLQWMRFSRQVRKHAGIGHFIEQEIDRLGDFILERVDATIVIDDEYLWVYGYRDRIAT